MRKMWLTSPQTIISKRSLQGDLNSRPLVYKTSALTPELWRLLFTKQYIHTCIEYNSGTKNRFLMLLNLEAFKIWILFQIQTGYNALPPPPPL